MKTLKLLLVLVGLAFTWNTQASHLIGGDIQYEYLGNNRYYIKLVLYRENTGIALPPSTFVDVKSASCGFTGSIEVFRTQQYFADAYDCISQSAAGYTPQVNVYETTVSNPLVLNLNCNDYKISWDVCCKPLGIDNVGNGVATNTLGFYFEAELNRRTGLGNNSSPSFISAPIAYLCDGGTYIYTQNTTEPDGDSLNYELVDPREVTTGAVTNIPYTTPFSKNNPISVDANNPYAIDAQTGNITFTAQLPPGKLREVSIIAVRVNEYRFDSTYYFWEKIGSSNREIQVIVSRNCNQEVNNGIVLDLNKPGIYMDSTAMLPVRNYGCRDTAITLYFTLPVECYSVSSDGTDFRLTAPNGQPIPIKRASANCDADAEADSIRLHLYKPLVFDGDYFLYSKTGTDGNTLLNRCGKSMSEFDTIIIRVSGCCTPEYEIKNVTVVEDQHTKVEWEVDTNTIESEIINFVRLFRSSDNGATYSFAGVASWDDESYTDYAVNPTMVDTQSYMYTMQVVANGQDLHFTDSINSILLTGSSSNGIIPMNWTPYNGWPTPVYTIDLGTKGTAGTFSWKTVSSSTLPTSGTNHTFNSSNLVAGNYALRVRTIGPGGYESESNWIEFGIPEENTTPQTVSLRVPNVFTPDDDDINSAFTIEGLEGYSRVEVSVYNRWGKRVYENNAYSNSMAWTGLTNNGQPLAEGTYFYVLTAYGNYNGNNVTKNGSITLLRDNR